MSQAMRVTSQVPRVRPGGFPADPDFPQLAIASDPQRMLELFRRHLEPAAGKRYHIETCVPVRFRCRQSTARYRTELGAALKYTLQARDAATGGAATLRCFVKVYRNDHGEHTFELLQSLGQRVERGETGYSVVRPVAYRKDLRTLVLEEAPGTALLHLLREGHDPAGPLRITARAVAAFNQDDVGSGAVARSSLAVQLEELRRGATIVEWARPELATHVRAITAAVAAGLEEVPPAPIHGDLKPDHVFLAGDRVIFIDLDSVVLGDPVRDPAHMFAYVAGRVGLDAMTAEQARAAAGLFAAEYFHHVPGAWRRRFGLHCAGALVEVASAIFRRQEAHWPEKVAAAVAAARDCLG